MSPCPPMTLQSEEPAAGPWRSVGPADLAAQAQELAGDHHDRPAVVAVDGRGASGKSTLTAALAEHLPGAAVVHTDDLAWHEPMFGWGHLLRDHVLAPLHRGEEVRLRPPAWAARGREGAIVVPVGSRFVLVEGTGAAQRSSADLLDAVLWVQADFVEAERRGIARDVGHGMNGDAAQSEAFWHEWMAHEIRFFADDRPWERADLVVAGTPTGQAGEGEVAMARGPLRPAAG